jgi:hypothetical protein
MDSIRIDTGEKRIAINDDPERVIVFNPSDIVFAEKFYRVVGEFEAKQQEYISRSDEIEAVTDKDSNGLPANMEERLALLRETCEYIREKVDYVFGSGTSQTVFGDAMTLNMFEQFFSGIMPFIRSTRTEKIKQYLPPAPVKKTRKRKSNGR